MVSFIEQQTMNRKLSVLSLILSVMALLSACSSIDCKLNGTVLCHYAIQNADGEDVTIECPLSVTLNRKIVSSDTVYINQQTGTSSFDLPMSYSGDVDEITMTLHLDSTLTVSDVIQITKTNEPYFESVDCAARYNHTIESVTHTNNFIKDIIITNPKVNNDATDTNILIRLTELF